jgi:2-desacetyl-2-hydroxyethyl bacteriochlorophyllide A dehydrogenase
MSPLSLYFTAPGQVAVREEVLPHLAPDKVLVQTLLSAISPGTELIIFRGQFPEDLTVDENIPTLACKFAYPLKYGYATVGRVVSTGAQVNPGWEGRLVFSLHAHESHFHATPDELLPLPEGMVPEDAIFLPHMETAVNLVMDGHPLLGEKVVVFGQGIIGLLTTALLARFPLSSLVTLDCFDLRRQASQQLGAHISLNSDVPEMPDQLHALHPEGADLVYELSGAPAVLNQAIDATGFAGRVVIGSWYGQKRAALDLGGRFHRSRIHLISSQVSTLAPELSARWSKTRRFEVAWQMLYLIRLSRFITQRFPISAAAQAYQLIDKHPEETIQVVFTYE